MTTRFTLTDWERDFLIRVLESTPEQIHRDIICDECRHDPLALANVDMHDPHPDWSDDGQHLLGMLKRARDANRTPNDTE